MSRWLPFSIGVLAVGSLMAQPRGNGPAGRDYGNGWGNALFPGGVRPLTIPGNVSFASRLGNTVAGTGYTGAPSGGGHGFGRRPVIVPVPFYVGGYTGFGYDGYGYGYQGSQPNVTVVPQTQEAPTPVVINQYFAPGATPADQPPAIRSYEAPSSYRPPDPAENEPVVEEGAPRATRAPAEVVEPKATIYLLALKDLTIQAAYAYWLEGQTLHYVTVQGSHNRVTMDLVDRGMTERLNKERSVDFSFSKAR